MWISMQAAETGREETESLTLVKAIPPMSLLCYFACIAYCADIMLVLIPPVFYPYVKCGD